MKQTIQFDEERIEFELNYRNQRTLVIRVVPGRVRVVVPKGTPEESVLDWVRSKVPWIREKLLELSDWEYRTPKLVEGEGFLYLGREFPLMIEDGKGKPLVHIDQARLVIQTPTRDQSVIKGALEGWYRERTLEKVRERIEAYQPILGVRPAKVKVSRARTRWASCTSKGTLLFNWRTIMAPPEVFDYLVVHEMSHLVHFNHSAEFWAKVASACPDYKQHREWLKINGHRMDLS